MKIVSKISFENKVDDYSGLTSGTWARLNDQPGQNPRQAHVVIDSQRTFQTFQGTGAAFSEIGGRSLGQLDTADQDQVMAKLFDVEKGAGFTNCRLPIGSSDFALSAYSLNDHEGDYEMKHFSLERDHEYLIPFIKKASKYSDNLKLHASPWSPPAWLKTNKDFVNGGSLIDDDKTYKAYATYLAKYVKAYQEEGFDINKLLIQNEPDSGSCFPTCVMEPDQMAKFAVEYLKPEFTQSNLDTEIWAGTFRTITGLQADDCMAHDECREIIDGVGFQYALPEHIYDFTRSYPEVKIMHTETPCYQGENTWAQAIALFNHFVSFMNVGCQVFSYWNMILDEKSESTWGWKQNSLVTIKDNKDILYNPDFYVMEMFAKNIRPGAKRIQCLCLLKESIAFINPDGSIVLFISNLNDQAIDSVVTIDGSDYEFTLEGSSMMALRLG